MLIKYILSDMLIYILKLYLMYILNLNLSIILMSVYFYYNNFKELLILKESLKEIFF